MIERRIRIIWKVLLLSLMLLSMIGLIELISISSDNRVNIVTIDTSDLLWYYQNLDSNDRQKIRQAMDYAIPRDQIITDIFNGYGVKIASPICPNMLGYDPTVQVRDKDINKALDLLEGIFGYRYDGITVTEPYFKMTLTAPDANNNANRLEWAKLVNQSFKTIGIDVELVTMDWDTIMSRHITNPVGIGFDYSHGGYDGLFIGFSNGRKNSNWSGITSGSFPPEAYNLAYIKNSEVDAIWDTALNSTNRAERIQALEDFQSWCYDTVPVSVIPKMMRFFAVNATLDGLDTYWEHNFQNYTLAKPSLTYSVGESLFNLNPLFARSTSDIVVRDNLHGCLMRRRGAHNITHPVGFLADSWTTSPDGLVWTINLRQGVQWHDNTEVTASDVVFTYHAVMEESLGSPLTDSFINAFNGNKNNIEQISKYTVKFTFPTFFPFAETEVFSLPILQKAQMESIPYSNWKTHGTNTGTITLNGSGPYKFASNNSGVVTIAKANSYNDLLMGHDSSAIGGGIWWPNATINTVDITVESDPNNAVNGLLAGTYDAIHPDTFNRGTQDIFNYAETVDTSSQSKLITGLRWGFQGLFYNQYSPIWGMNPGDLHEMYPTEYPDTTPPTIIIDSPISPIYATGTIEISFHTDFYPKWSSNTDAKNFWYYLSGVDEENQTWTTTIQRPLEDGTYTLHVYANDSAGNVAHESVTFTIDTTVPTISIDSPVTKVYTTDTITVDFSGDAEEYWYYIAGVDSENQSWTGSVSRTLADGIYTLHAFGKDAAGNVVHVTVTFTIDTTVTPTTTTTTTTTTRSNGVGTPALSLSLAILTIFGIILLKKRKCKPK